MSTQPESFSLEDEEQTVTNMLADPVLQEGREKAKKYDKVGGGCWPSIVHEPEHLEPVICAKRHNLTGTHCPCLKIGNPLVPFLHFPLATL
eukprot:1160947-Pelagomonas_calceolata.AAC.15